MEELGVNIKGKSQRNLKGKKDYLSNPIVKKSLKMKDWFDDLKNIPEDSSGLNKGTKNKKVNGTINSR